MKHNRILIPLVFLLLTGCGYQMRGSARLPETVESVHIQANRSASPLIAEVQRALSGSGARMVRARDQADAILDITRDDMKRRVLSVSDRSRVQEFMLDYDVEFRLIDPAGKILVPPQRLELHQAYEFSETQVLGKSGQEDVLRAELYREMAALMLDRIAVTTGS